MLARLQPHVGRAQARAAAANLASRLAADFPEYHRGRGLAVYDAASVRIQPEIDGSIRPAGTVLMAVSGLVLLVACTNLASLLLARGWRRGHELGIRQALGATRWDLVRQLLVESLLLGLAGGAIGVLVAWWSVAIITAQAEALSLPLNLTVGVGWRVLAFTLALSVAAGLAFGTAPALRVTSPALAAALKDPETTVRSPSPARRRRMMGLRGVFVIAQVAASMVLLVAAGLLVRAVQDAKGVNLGAAAASRVAFVQADTGQAGYDQARAASLFRDFADRVRALPGVESVSWANRLPVTVGPSSTLVIDEVRQRTGAETVEVEAAWVGHGYFDTFRIPLLHGRTFTEEEAAARRRVAVVSRSMAQRYWGRADVVGETYFHQGGKAPVEIIGVVGDVKVETPGETPTPVFFYPLAPGGMMRLAIMARGSGPPDALASAMRGLLRDMDPAVPVIEAGTMADHVSRSLSLQRAAAGALGLFGALALLLAAIGLYGVVAASVTERTAEVGIRMALGAGPREIVAMLVGEVMVLVAAGGAIGLVAATFMAPALRSLVIGLSRIDLATMAAVTALLAAVALFASWLPARRAVSGGTLAAIKQR
ncbi:MAG: FtsX-like permease family protein [Acidobacteria bacterium]|nr:MAG: FtsX-like permease family protein [Acidobacteriota bacterium]